MEGCDGGMTSLLTEKRAVLGAGALDVDGCVGGMTSSSVTSSSRGGCPSLGVMVVDDTEGSASGASDWGVGDG